MVRTRLRLEEYLKKNPPSSTEAPKEKNEGLVVIDPYWHSAINVFGSDKDGKKNRDLWNVTLGDAQYQWRCSAS